MLLKKIGIEKYMQTHKITTLLFWTMIHGKTPIGKPV